MADWDSVSSAAPTPTGSSPWDQVSAPVQPASDEGAHPFINHFVSAVGGAVLDSAVKNMAETGKVPSLFGYLSQLPGAAEKGEEASIKGGAQLSANIAGPFLSNEQRQTLQDKGLYNQDQVAAAQFRNNGQPLTAENYKNLLADGIMQSPVGQLSTAMYSTFMAPVAPLFDVGTKAAQNLGATPGDVNLAMAGLTILGVAHSGGVVGKTAEGLEHHVTGSPESTFMGETEPTPQMDEVAHKAAEVNRPAAPEQPKAVPAFDANQVARNIAPQVFSEYDALSARRDSYQQFLDDLRDKQKQEAVASAPHNQEIADLQAKLETANPRKAKIYQQQIDDLTAQNDAYVADQTHPLNATPDINFTRSELSKASIRLGQLAPDVRKAYEMAEEYRPAEKAQSENIPDLGTEEPNLGTTETAPPEEKPAVQPSTENNIAGPLSEHLQSLGRPKEEADASAALVAAHYQAVADMGWAKGTADEIYEQHKPEIVQGEAKKARRIVELSQKPGTELEQGDSRGSFLLPFGDFKGGVIGLRPDADASTLIHELGHSWLDEMHRFAEDPDAPQSLLDTKKTTRDWLGAKGDKPLTRGQHEKFARGFERFMMEGVAPSKALAGVFGKFHEWLTKIYQTVQRLRSPLTDEIRGVFDKLLEANPEKTIIAPDHEPGKMMADVHETDARTTPPEEQDKVGDNVEREIDATVKLHEPEIADAIRTGETGNIPETVADHQESAGEGNRAATGSASEEPGTVAAGSGATEAGGVRPREEPSAVANAGRIPGSPEQSLIDKAGNIRLDLLTKDADITELMHQIADANGGYESARGQAITQRDISDFADSLGIQEQKINIDKLQELTRVDGIPLAFRIRAGRVALKQSADAIMKIMNAADEWTEQNAAEYAEAKARHIMIAKTVSAVTQEWGQAGHAFRDISGEQMKAAQDITELLQSATGRTFEELKREAKLGSKLKDSKQVAKYTTDSSKPTFVDKMLWYRNNCLLSGPITHGTYLEANVVNLLMRPLETAVAARLGERAGATEGAVRGEAMEMLYSMANMNAFRNAAESWKEHAAVLPGVQGKKYTTTTFDSIPIEGPLGTALHQVSRSINALHSFVFTMAYEQNIAAKSFRMAVREGLEPGTDSFAARLADLRANQPPDMMEEATTTAFDEVNMGKSGPVLGKLSLFLNSNAATRFMFPFVKMEMNVLKNTWLERTPVGFLAKDIRANLLGVNGEAARDMQRAKVLVTTGTAGVLFTLANQYVNGDGPSDPNKNRIWRLTHTPNSIQIGDTAFSLKGCGRIGALLRFGAGIKESLSGWEGDDGDHIAKALLEHIAHSFDSSFTDGLKNTIDLLSSPRQKAGAFIQNFATQFLPFSVGMGQIAHEVDPFVRDARTTNETGPLAAAEGIMKAAASRIPAASYLLEHQYDVFGNPIRRDSEYYSQYENDPVVQRMNALHMAVGRLDSKVFSVKLDAGQYAEYSREAGIITKESLDRLITPQFAQYPLEVQVKSIHEVITMSRDQAKQRLITNHPDIRDKAIEFQRTAHGQ